MLIIDELQKLAMFTHYGLITNIIQTADFEGYVKADTTEVQAGAIPFSHSYGIIVTHLTVWRGDQYIVFPRFDLDLFLQAVPKYKIERLYLVSDSSMPSITETL
jgi:acyl-CoA synthetase (AMP-forming)/AMP-acid ligase II